MKKIICIIMSLALWVGFTDAIIFADQGLKIEEIEEAVMGMIRLDGQETKIKETS